MAKTNTQLQDQIYEYAIQFCETAEKEGLGSFCEIVQYWFRPA